MEINKKRNRNRTNTFIYLEFKKNHETTPDYLFKIYTLLAKLYYELNQIKDFYYYIQVLRIPNNKFILAGRELDSIMEFFYLKIKKIPE